MSVVISVSGKADREKDSRESLKMGAQKDEIGFVSDSVRGISCRSYCGDEKENALSREGSPSSPHTALAGTFCSHSSEFFTSKLLNSGLSRQQAALL